MTSILAIETSTPACSVALATDDGRFSRYSEEPRSHTRLIMGIIDEVLCEAGLAVDQLDALAVTVGPGSFTGLRIGFSTAQGLAFGADIPVIPVSTLQVMAQTYRRKYQPNINSSDVIMSVLDARMSEFNCGAYQINNRGEFVATLEDQLLNKDDALQLCETLNPSVIIGDAGTLVDGSNNVHGGHQSIQELYPDAIDLVDIGLINYQQGAAVPISQVELVYLRGTSAWKKHTPLRAI
jgi:tRNA threonylcarbamoyladenosine biosynthesis protein TsaB